MTATTPHPDGLRREAARIASALLRCAEAAAHPMDGQVPPGAPRVATDAYFFLPSRRATPRDQVEAFLVGLPSPALLAPTMRRGVVALLLLHELSGDRRRWFEKNLGNFALGLDETGARLGLSPASPVLLEFDDEQHVFSFAGVREWTQQFPVDVGWTVWSLEGDPRAVARLMVRRSGGGWFRGRSCLALPGERPPGTVAV